MSRTGRPTITAIPWKGHTMELRFDRGKSQYVVVNEDIGDSEDFMYPTYCRLVDALAEVARKSDTVRGKSPASRRVGGPDASPSAQDLYRYGNNVIAISGRRGQGKTSAMLSFSASMASGFHCKGAWEERFRSYSFLVLDPIDPTVLEASQSPLMLVLSRMYGKAEASWERLLSQGGYGLGERTVSDSTRNELVNQFQKCLSGIREVKMHDQGGDKGLAPLHSLSDSSQLKASFYKLVDMLLDFCAQGLGGKRILVMQLDDTDFQVGKGYEVLDDIRKYLTLPNVVILMAADMDLMHKVVAQHFSEELGVGLEQKILSGVEVQNNAHKYLDKLIPPDQVVYLPSLSREMANASRRLQVRLADDGELLLPRKEEEGLSLENVVLRFLYRKTGLLCVSRPREAHGFIPTTLRGLMQLLNLLASLEDIPLVPGGQRVDPRTLAGALDKQLRTRERNLGAFQDYLLTTWVNAKFSSEDWILPAHEVRLLLLRLIEEPGLDGLCALLAREIDALGACAEDSSSSRAGEFGESGPGAPHDLAKVIADKIRGATGRMDRYFMVAVSLAIALRWHKAAVMQMRSELPTMRSRPSDGGSYAFHLAPEDTGLPKKLMIRCVDGDGSLASRMNGAVENVRDRLKSPRSSAILDTLAPDGVFRILHLVQVVLCMAKGVGTDSELMSYRDKDQKKVYDAQASALLVACNPELQRELILAEERMVEAAAVDSQTLRDVVNDISARLNALETTIDRASSPTEADGKGEARRCPSIISDSLLFGRITWWADLGERELDPLNELLDILEESMSEYGTTAGGFGGEYDTLAAREGQQELESLDDEMGKESAT